MWVRANKRQSWADFIQGWFGAILLSSRGKGTCLGNYWRELGTVALKRRLWGKKSNLLCMVQLHCYLWWDWAGGRETAQKVLTFHSLHHSGDLQMYLFWSKNTHFLFGINVSRTWHLVQTRFEGCTDLHGETGSKCGREEPYLGGHCLPQQSKATGGKNIVFLEWDNAHLPQELGREKHINFLCAGIQVAPLSPITKLFIIL